ncbi:hypothetical protein [Bacillus sp. 196mf]|uniref:anthrax toxin lethal factor-related metalloendopeptidase n=1 Tax=Bacillus sp. 196mf TaxID=1761754 RepID=UPI000D7BC53B|nr:hypothetical protein [Bacillus sp. 196mf]PYE88609.1 toxin lethal factor-like protein [Bacillus sp. 196mf]
MNFKRMKHISAIAITGFIFGVSSISYAMEVETESNINKDYGISLEAFPRANKEFEKDKKTKEKEEKENKKWNEQRIKFNKILTDRESILLENLKTPLIDDLSNDNSYYDINKALRRVGGDFDKFPEINQDKEVRNKDSYKKNIKDIDEIFEKKAIKIEKSIEVYSDIQQDYDYDLSFLRSSENPNTIDREKGATFIKKTTHGIHSDYLVVKRRESNDSNSIIKRTIKLEKGQRIIPLDEDTMVISRNMGREITDMKIVTINGKEYIREKSKLVSKDKIDKKIQKKAVELNQYLISEYNLPKDKKYIDLDLTAQYASWNSALIPKFLNDLKKTMDNEVLKHLLEFMAEQKGALTFTDMSISSDEDVQEHSATYGLYDEDTRNVFLTVSANRIPYGSLHHEFGHVLDHALHQERGDMRDHDVNVGIAGLEEYKNIFYQERWNLGEYGATNSFEHFAEAVKFFFTDVEYLKQNAPQTYQFIKKAIDDFKLKKGHK